MRLRAAAASRGRGPGQDARANRAAAKGSEWKPLSRVRPCATPWTLQSMGFSRPEHWSGEPFPPPGDLPSPGMEPRSPALQADSLPAKPQGSRAAKGTCNSPRSCFLTARALSDVFIWVLYSCWMYIILILHNISLKNKKEI